MKVGFFILLLNGVISCCFAQSYSRKEIEKIVSSKYAKLDTAGRNLFVLNGIAFDKDKIENELKKYSRHELYIQVFEELRWINFTYIILFEKTYKQSSKEKRVIIKNLKEHLNTNISDITILDSYSKAEIVSVNGDILSEKVSRNYVNRLKIKDIEFVLTFENPNPLFYGKRAENGLVEIYLKKK